jgi:four helix bundle protein
MLNSNSKNIVSRTYKFSLDIIELTNNLPNKRSAWIIADQLIRSATSIGANHIEAKGASSRLEYNLNFKLKQ